MDDPDASVDAVVEYCDTQARLLSGQSERLSEEIDTLLDEIDAEAAVVRERLTEQGERAEEPQRPSGPGDGVDEAAVEELEAKQATVADKQARLEDVGALAARYVDLAESLQDEQPDVTEAVTKVLELEATADAHQFFDERETLLETATDQ